MSDLNNPHNEDTILDTDSSDGVYSSYINEELKRSYLDYSMTVIVNRAIPDAFDGCKPVQRRIIYAMAEAGYYNASPYKKCVTVVGRVLGNYHPHGQSAVYDALVRMAQSFSLNMPLIDGQGNFGSIDGDPPAADRYTECRLSKIARYLINDYEKNTVPMVDNFDASLKMPAFLPVGFPHLLVNGAYGIAVGMSTSIPTHNLGEVIEATCALIDNPNASLEELLLYIQGPDLPTGGIINVSNLVDVYREGRGSFVCRGVAEVENMSIIISEIPYQLNKSRLVEEIIDLAKHDHVPEIAEVRDESSLEGIRVVVDLKRGSNPDLILRQLFAKTSLEMNINIHLLALEHGRPRQFGLVPLLQHFINEREKVIINRTKFDLKNAEFRAHVLFGQILAVSKLDTIIEVIRKSKNKAEAVENLQKLEWKKKDVEIGDEDTLTEVIRLSEVQIKAILEIRLQSLTTLEHDKILIELKDLKEKMLELKKILDSRGERYRLMKADMNKIKEQFATKRKTVIEMAENNTNVLSFIKEEDCVVTLSSKGFMKMTPLDAYRTQSRGGKGKRSDKITNEDEIDPTLLMLVASTHDSMIVFTSKGIAYSLPVREISQKKPVGIVNLINIDKDEKISAMLPITVADSSGLLNGDAKKYLLFVTSSGSVRLNDLSEFVKLKSNGKKAMPLNAEKNESLAAVLLVNLSDEVLLAGSNGKAIRFEIGKNVRVFKGRDSTGVIGMNLPEGSHIVSATVIKPQDVNKSIFTVTCKGIGKVSPLASYRKTARDAKGVIVATIDEKTGPLVGAYQVEENDEVLLMGSFGQTIRCPISQIRVVGRSSKGVQMISLQQGDSIAHVFVIKSDTDNGEDELGIDAGCE